jgi:hypothetical protein
MSSVQSIEQRVEGLEQMTAERFMALEQSLAEMRQSMAEAAAVPVKAAKTPKSKKPAAEGGSAPSGEAKAPTAWNQLVSETVADMKQNGWVSWTDLKEVVWPGSRLEAVKDKKGVETGQSHYVYDGGEHDGKAPSPALGGMVRASYLKSLTDPVAKGKAQAYHAKLAEKRSNASTGSGAREEPVADAPEAGKKGGRPKMTEEQKAAAKLKREAKKASAAASVVTEEAEMAAEETFEDVPEQEEQQEQEEEQSTTPVPPPPAPKPSVKASTKTSSSSAAPATAAAPKNRYGPPPPKLAGSSMAAIKADLAKKAAPKKVDISLFSWTFQGTEYYTNDRQDVVDVNTGAWVGRFNGTEIDMDVPEPADFANGVSMRESA